MRDLGHCWCQEGSYDCNNLHLNLSGAIYNIVLYHLPKLVQFSSFSGGGQGNFKFDVIETTIIVSLSAVTKVEQIS